MANKRGNPKWVKGMAPAAPGRPKGCKNKFTRDVVANILNVADHLETIDKGLLKRAELDPDWYYEHFYKPLVPRNVNLNGDLSVQIEIFIGPKKVT